MRAKVVILSLFFILFSGRAVFGAADAKNCDTQNADYLVDGLMYRGEGNCEEAVKSYQMARQLRQFKEDWIYYLAVADCFAGMKRLDEAIDAYTKVIGATTNRTLQAEMYRGRARAYYLKSVSPDTIDPKIMDLAKRDLNSAINLGADVSDLKKDVTEDIETKPAGSVAEAGNIVTGEPVTIVESPWKMILGDGEYVLYISADTKIKDQQGTALSSSGIKPGDLIDVSFNQSYRNKADGMTHISAETITLHRVAAPKTATEEMMKKPLAPNPVETLILSRMNMLADEIKYMEEKLQAATKEPAKPKTKKKTLKKNIETKNQLKKKEMQGEIK
ncbi:MAG: tetratricopeptide repeat protein [Dissulfurispiraceae bacterium]|jgi:tetratricopeptide (TPR) repeat protein